MPMIELFLNPFAGSGFNLIAATVWIAAIGLIILAIKEQGEQK
jgi:hypothetical protein